MKQSSFRAICLILMASIAVLSAFGDEQTVVLVSKVVETFNEADDAPYDWWFEASKFAHKDKDDDGNVTDSWPKISYVPAFPEQFFRTNTDGLKSLGIWGQFDRKGYNWIDVYPIEKGDTERKAVSIPMAKAPDAPASDDPDPKEVRSDGSHLDLSGRIQYIDLWVWGSNLRYAIEAYFRDYRGVMHVINLGSIKYTGWKNLRAPVPVSIPQSQTILPKFAGLSFVKFRIWTEPTERVNDFYIYLDHFKILTDTFETPFDGDRLETPPKDTWKNGIGG